MTQLKNKLYFALFFILIFFPELSHCEDAFMDQLAIAAYSKKSPHKAKTSKYEGVDSWTPYFTWIGNVENQDQRTFSQITVGVGFLYLSDVKGNFTLKPSPPNSATNNAEVKKVGGFSYNKTPVFEFNFGYRIFDWLKLAIAVQNQTSIHMQSRFAPSLVPVGATRVSSTSLPETQFRANLGLNSVYLKAIFELPWTMILKSWMYALYFNAGVGPCWQIWTDLRQYIQFQTSNGVETTFVNTLSQKYGASALWTLDAGIRTKSANVNSFISLLFGCKFISWGKVPNLGSDKDQSSWGYAFEKPYSARMLYSFAPYIGVQWNF